MRERDWELASIVEGWLLRVLVLSARQWRRRTEQVRNKRSRRFPLPLFHLPQPLRSACRRST